MISCSKCSFKIKKNMQYCLKNNMCPSCGSSIMNNSDIKVSKLIANKLIDAGFSENIFELSIFIMENFTKPDSVESNKEVVTEDIAIEEDSSKLTSEDQEFHGQEYIEESLDELLEEDEDDRVLRLKKLARNNLVKNKKGVSVRRVGSND